MFFRREPVFGAGLACALLTMFLVPPDGAYPGNNDLRVLALLLCLLTVFRVLLWGILVAVVVGAIALLERNTLLTAALTSQVISNVPAAVLAVLPAAAGFL